MTDESELIDSKFVEPAADADSEFDYTRSRRRRRLLIIGGIVLNLVLVPILVAVIHTEIPSTPHYYGSTDPPTAIYTPAETLDDTLDRQAADLIAGDESGWLAPLNQHDAPLVAQYRELYDRLRTLGVTGLRHTELIDPDDPYVVTVTYGLCAQTTVCPKPDDHPEVFRLPPAELYSATLTWQPIDHRHNQITGFTPLPPDQKNPTQPLLAGPRLVTMRGQRVLVAAGPDLASALPDAVRVADAAARNADRYDQLAGWEHPTQYVVYLADSQQWRTWFGGEAASSQREILGYEFADSRSSSVVVINYTRIGPTGASLSAVMRHEFGHVISLLGADSRADTAITEGIAEYIEEDSRPIGDYEQLPAVADYLRTHQWNGDPAQLDQYIYEDNENSNAAYGIGYLTLRCLTAQFGQGTMFDFVAATVHDGQEDEVASFKVLGQPWLGVFSACLSYIREVA
jgi:hypothetical protein